MAGWPFRFEVRIEPLWKFRRHHDGLDLVIFDKCEHGRLDAQMLEVFHPRMEFRCVWGNGFPMHLVLGDGGLRLPPIVLRSIVNHRDSLVADRF